MSLKRAMQEMPKLSDCQVRNFVFHGSFIWLIAAIRQGRRTPPDLAGRRSGYCVPQTLPWDSNRTKRRAYRLLRLIGYDRTQAEALARYPLEPECPIPGTARAAGQGGGRSAWRWRRQRSARALGHAICRGGTI